MNEITFRNTTRQQLQAVSTLSQQCHQSVRVVWLAGGCWLWLWLALAAGSGGTTANLCGADLKRFCPILGSGFPENVFFFFSLYPDCWKTQFRGFLEKKWLTHTLICSSLPSKTWCTHLRKITQRKILEKKC